MPVIFIIVSDESVPLDESILYKMNQKAHGWNRIIIKN